MRTLICDLNVYDEGHHIAYLNAIMPYSADRDDLIFLFNKKAVSFCPILAGDRRVFFVDETFLEENRANVMRGKWREFHYIRQFAIEHAIEKLLLLEIDQYQLAIGLQPSPFRIDGIIFRSFHMIGVTATSLPGMAKNILYRAKKRLMFQVFRLNKKVEPLFLLNDRAGCARYPNYFKYLPDPIFEAPATMQYGKPASPASSNLRNFFDIAPKAHIFFVSGAMGERKNIQNTVDAYQAAQLNGPSVLLIAGKVRADYRVAFDAAINSFTAKDPQKRLIVVDEYIDDDLLAAWFNSSDTILLCYSNFYGSSGLMGKAAEHGKTCIVPDKGLLFDLCKEYSLGYAADPDKANSMARAMVLAQKDQTTAAGHSRFVQDHSEKSFLSTLIP
ncbi:MAG TPA: hypothetical protein VGM30_05620 [Puia sp.]|jgi:glycosyltransferase involved in cell wall biosynthesis